LDFENRYRCKDGTYKWLSWNSITFVKDGVMYGFARDVTEKKQREEVLKSTLEELQVRNHELDNYVYKVSHDLRAPLCSIRGLIDLVKMEKRCGQYLSIRWPDREPDQQIRPVYFIYY
jgi:signal transduction histidine kinase